MKLEEILNFDSLKQFPYRINWNINSVCNLNCKYCFFPHIKKENPVVFSYSPEHICDSFEKTGKEWIIFLSGGEPFLYPSFTELCKLLTKRNYIQISTNLVSSEISAFANEINPERVFIINASVHVLSHSNKSLKHFASNFLLLKNKGFPIIASYVTYPELFKRDRIKRDFEILKDNGIWPVIPLTFNGLYKGKQYPGTYSKKQLNTIYELSTDKREMLNATAQMLFKGYDCVAGENYFFMDIAGNVQRCVTIKKDCGNLFKGTFLPLVNTSVCDAEYCNDSCNGIISVKKEHHIKTDW